jgi:hypothetical protein
LNAADAKVIDKLKRGAERPLAQRPWSSRPCDATYLPTDFA